MPSPTFLRSLPILLLALAGWQPQQAWAQAPAARASATPRPSAPSAAPRPSQAPRPSGTPRADAPQRPAATMRPSSQPVVGPKPAEMGPGRNGSPVSSPRPTPAPIARPSAAPTSTPRPAPTARPANSPSYAPHLASPPPPAYAPRPAGQVPLAPAPTAAPATPLSEGLPSTARVPLAQRYEEVVPFEGPGPHIVRVSNLRGQVQVLAWDRPTLWVQALKRPSAPLASQELEAYPKVKPQAAKVGPNEAAVAVSFPPEVGPYPSVAAAHLLHTWVDMRIVLPRNAVLELDQSDGDISAAGTSGRLSLSSTEGRIHVGPHTGPVQVKTARGYVQVHDVVGDVEAQGEVGPMRLWRVQGDVRARSTEGQIRVEVAPNWVGEVRVHTVAGAFRSDLATAFSRGGQPPLGFVGLMFGPRSEVPKAGDLPLWRLEIDTTGGDAVVAAAPPPGAGLSGGTP